MKNVDIFITDLMTLRYIIPFARRLQKKCYLTFGVKINNTNIAGFNTEANLKHCFCVLEKNLSGEIHVDILDQDLSSQYRSTDVLLAVDNKFDNNYDYSHKYTIQHCYDTQHRDNWIYPKQTTAIVNNQFYADVFSRSCAITNYLVSPIPPTFWDMPWIDNNSSKDITLFYPENGFHRQAIEIFDFCTSLGYRVIIKQRGKNQPIPKIKQFTDHVVVDELWYPSESILLPNQSVLSIGFGTTAYVDICAAGLEFIDIALPPYAKEYAKPTIENYHFASDVEYAKIVIENILNNPKNKSARSEERSIGGDEFVAQLLQHMDRVT